MQEHSTKENIPIENLKLELAFDGGLTTYRGLYLDLWDQTTKKIIKESERIFTQEEDIGEFNIIVSSDDDSLSKERFKCPLYVTGKRNGDSGRSGRNPNFIEIFQLDTEDQFSISHCIKMGVGLISQKATMDL